MSIIPTTAATAGLGGLANNPPTAHIGAQAGQTQMNQFLALLTAQLKNQNPTQPTDPTQFVAQLAQFSTVEQSVQTNATLGGIAKAMSTMALSQYSGLVNRTITADATKVTVPASGAVSTPMNFAVTNPALSNIRLAITNAAGGVVATLPVSGTSGSLTFDGTDGKGRRLPPGDYGVALVGTGGVGSDAAPRPAGTLSTTGVVTSVTQGQGGEWMLRLKNGQLVPAGAITSSG
jgi:flagellar basal-body rod modification protein FlgD